MTTSKPSYPTIEQLDNWLTHFHNTQIKELAPLSGGFWSSAFSYRIGTQDYVLRLSDVAEGFAIDKAAMRFNSPNLPIPKVVETGKALGFNYAISERHYGRFIETTTANEGSIVGHALETLLAEMRAVSTLKNDPVIWHDPEKSKTMTWHKWLQNGLIDNPNALVSGWRTKLAENPEIDNLFVTCESKNPGVIDRMSRTKRSDSWRSPASECASFAGRCSSDGRILMEVFSIGRFLVRCRLVYFLE